MRRSSSWPGLVVAVPLLAGCASVTGEDPVRVGGAVGYYFSETRIEGGANNLLDRDLEPGESIGGFLEAMIRDGEADLHCRAVTTVDTVPLEANSAEATVVQAMAFVLASSQVLPPSSWLRLRPMIGPGIGYTHVDFDPVLDSSPSQGPTIGLAAALELETFDHLTFGAMGWASLYGLPGDTDGNVETLMLYVGVRF